MLLETTLYGVLVVLAVSLTLVVLLLRKPRLRFRGTPVRTTKREHKPDKDKGVTQPPKTGPHHFKYPGKLPENSPIPQEHRGSTRITESQAGLTKPTTLGHTSKTPQKPPPVVQTEETPEKSSERVEALTVIKEERVPTSSPHPRQRPRECPHFFGYLREIPRNTTMPDECLGCPRMLECLYYNASSGDM